MKPVTVNSLEKRDKKIKKKIQKKGNVVSIRKLLD